MRHKQPDLPPDGSSLIQAKQSSKPAKNGWAPGWYAGRCGDCGAHFIGDKRARQCADCAYKEPEPKQYGICYERDDNVYWLTKGGFSITGNKKFPICVWDTPENAQYQLYLLHAAQAPNAYVAECPSGEKYVFEGPSWVQIDMAKINRVEVIDENGRQFVAGPMYSTGAVKAHLDIQDDGRTLKVFLKRR